MCIHSHSSTCLIVHKRPDWTCPTWRKLFCAWFSIVNKENISSWYYSVYHVNQPLPVSQSLLYLYVYRVCDVTIVLYRLLWVTRRDSRAVDDQLVVTDASVDNRSPLPQCKSICGDRRRMSYQFGSGVGC